MEQSLPPRPGLFFRLVLEVKPSGFRQLFSSLWITHPHTLDPYPFAVLKMSAILCHAESAGVSRNRARKVSITSMINEAV
jgi:hypothetical protein